VAATHNCKNRGMTNSKSSHAVAIVGGATAGAEIAHRLAQRGVLVAVFEQNARPYGKIEDGLPRWHERLREKEYATIREKLSHPLIHFVPRTKVGEDVAFPELVNDWGFSCVVLASGAWRDRPLPIEGAEGYVGRGLVYQNSFVIAFNHGEDSSFDGERFDVHDDSIVVGGGLASIDVAKIVTLTCVQRALADRGIEVAITQIEVKGIPKTLAAHDLSWEDLQLKGCTIFYRRREEDMPLVSIPEDATPERIEKVKKSRRTLLRKASEKFKLTVEPLAAPDGLIVEDGKLTGLRFRRTRVEDGRVIAGDETFERRGPVVISSIGSIPDPIEGIDMKGELFDFADWHHGRLAPYPTVFSVGNVVTGKGNIVASRKHASAVSEEAVEVFLGVADAEGATNSSELLTSGATEVAENVAQRLEEQDPSSATDREALTRRIAARQKAVGYTGDLASWLADSGGAC
jgi:NADPH-dependent glutamate synthase beta subunit-like oxidoreductase